MIRLVTLTTLLFMLFGVKSASAHKPEGDLAPVMKAGITEFSPDVSTQINDLEIISFPNRFECFHTYLVTIAGKGQKVLKGCTNDGDGWYLILSKP